MILKLSHICVNCYPPSQYTYRLKWSSPLWTFYKQLTASWAVHCREAWRGTQHTAYSQTQADAQNRHTGGRPLRWGKHLIRDRPDQALSHTQTHAHTHTHKPQMCLDHRLLIPLTWGHSTGVGPQMSKFVCSQPGTTTSSPASSVRTRVHLGLTAGLPTMFPRSCQISACTCSLTVDALISATSKHMHSNIKWSQGSQTTLWRNG